jgi:hypothetical protein
LLGFDLACDYFQVLVILLCMCDLHAGFVLFCFCFCFFPSLYCKAHFVVFQPPLWERYQQEVKEWELAMTKINTNLPIGCQEKAAPIEKPPMFAFCMKPRGLEVPNKGSKQRSQRKFSVSGHSNAIVGDQDGFLAFGNCRYTCTYLLLLF